MKTYITLLTTIAVLLGASVILVPASLEIKLGLALGLINSVIHLGVAIINAVSLGGFTPRFKLAYILVCAATVMLAIGSLQTPIFVIFHAFNSVWAQSGAANIPYIALGVLFVFALHIFARLFNVKGPFASLWVVFGTAIVVGVVGFFIPTALTDRPERVIHLATAATCLRMGILLTQLVLVYQIRQRASIMYVPVFAWIFVSFVFYAVNGIQLVILGLVLPSSHWYITSGLSDWPYFLAGLAMLKAALAFHNVRHAEDLPGKVGTYNFFGRSVNPKPNELKTSVDVVVYVAQFVSEPSAVDPILDDLRAVTVNLSEGQAPTAEQQAKLAGVIVGIEGYLANKEPIRRRTASEIHELITRKFRPVVNEPAFWNHLGIK